MKRGIVLLLVLLLVIQPLSTPINFFAHGYQLAAEESTTEDNTSEEVTAADEDKPAGEDGVFQGIVPFSPFIVTFAPNAVDATIPPEHSTRIVDVAGDTIGNANMPPPALIQRPDFRLFGWNEQADGNGAWFTGYTPVIDHMTVHAIWGIEVTFAGNGIDLPMANNVNDVADYSPRIVLAGTSVNDTDGMVWPDDPSRPGFTFVGWYNTTAQDGGTRFYGHSPITTATALTARWLMNPIYTLTFDPGSGSLVPGQVAVRQGVGPGADGSPGVSIAGSHPGPFWLNRDQPGTPNSPAIPRHNNAPLAEHPTATLHSWRWAPHGGGGLVIAGVNDLTAQLNFVLPYDRTAHANWVYRITFQPNFPGGGTPAVRDIPTYEMVPLGPGGALIPATPPAPVINGTVLTHATGWIGLPGYPMLWPQPGLHTQPWPSDPVRQGYIFGGWWYPNPHPSQAEINAGAPEWAAPQDPNNPPSPFQQFFGNTLVNASRSVWALWIPESGVTVTFNLDGGVWIGAAADLPVGMLSGSVNPQTRTIPSGSNIRSSPSPPGTSPRYNVPIIPTRTDYVFMGWYTAPNGDGTQFRGTAPITADTHLYARWLPAVIINLDFGGLPGTVTTPAGANQRRGVPGYTLQQIAQIWRDTRGVATAGSPNHLPTFTRPGYTGLIEHMGTLPVYGLSGWSNQQAGVFSTVANGQGVRFGMDTVVTPEMHNSTVHAVWTGRVTFNNNHPTYVVAANIYTVRQTTSGYSFADNTVAAHHQSPAPLGPDLTPSQQPLGTEWPTLDNWQPLNLDGYIFRGWNTLPDRSGNWYTINSTITGDLALYAIFSHGLVFSPNGAPDDGTVILPENEYREVLPPLPHPSLGAGWPPDPVWTLPGGGQVGFVGWNSEPTGTGSWYTAASQIIQSRTLYAIWGIAVSFDSNGGQFANGVIQHNVSIVTETLGAAVFAGIPTPTHPDGLRFRHWNTQQTLANVIAAPGVVVGANAPQITGPITFYAQWDVPVTFNPGLGTMPGENAGVSVTRFTPKNGSFATVFPAPLPAIETGTMPGNPTRPGFTFVGWLNAAGVNLQPDEVRDMPRTIAAVYTAQWSVIPPTMHDVTFELNGGNVAGDMSDIVNQRPEDSLVGTPPLPARQGYVFIGWVQYGSAGILTSGYVANMQVSGPLTFVAQWGLYVPSNGDNGGDDDDDNGDNFIPGGSSPQPPLLEPEQDIPSELYDLPPVLPGDTTTGSDGSVGLLTRPESGNETGQAAGYEPQATTGTDISTETGRTNPQTGDNAGRIGILSATGLAISLGALLLLGKPKKNKAAK